MLSLPVFYNVSAYLSDFAHVIMGGNGKLIDRLSFALPFNRAP